MDLPDDPDVRTNLYESTVPDFRFPDGFQVGSGLVLFALPYYTEPVFLLYKNLNFINFVYRLNLISVELINNNYCSNCKNSEYYLM